MKNINEGKTMEIGSFINIYEQNINKTHMLKKRKKIQSIVMFGNVKLYIVKIWRFYEAYHVSGICIGENLFEKGGCSSELGNFEKNIISISQKLIKEVGLSKIKEEIDDYVAKIIKNNNLV